MFLFDNFRKVKMIMKKYLIFIFLVVNAFSHQAVFSQTQDELNLSSVMTLEKASCEMNSAFLINLIQNTARDKFIIVVSHQGNNEKKNFGQRRLNNVEIFFTTNSSEPSNNRLSNSFLTAEGKKSDKNSFWDFYVAGKLELRIFFDKNQDLNVYPCVFTPEEKPCSTNHEKLLYPCKK